MTTPADTIDMESYKSLQRRLDREQKSRRQLAAENTELKAGQSRLEKDMEGILALMSRADPESETAVNDYFSARSKRKEFDVSFAQNSRRLAELLDEYDADYEDEKFSDVRARLADADARGDAQGLEDALKAAREIVSPTAVPLTQQGMMDLFRRFQSDPDSFTLEDNPLEETSTPDVRVDTRSSTTNRRTSLTRGSIQDAIESGSHEDRKALLDRALDQMST